MIRLVPAFAAAAGPCAAARFLEFFVLNGSVSNFVCGAGLTIMPRSSDWRPSACCSTGWRRARLCRSTPPLPCAGRSTLSGAPRRPFSIPKRRASFSVASMFRRRRPARPRHDWLDGLFLRPHRRGAFHEGCPCPEPHALGALHEKGSKRHEMPCHHNLEDYLIAHLDGCDLRAEPKGPLFRTIGREPTGSRRLPCPRPTPVR